MKANKSKSLQRKRPLDADESADPRTSETRKAVTSYGGITKRVIRGGLPQYETRPGVADMGETVTMRKGNITVTVTAPKGFFKKLAKEDKI